MAFQEIWRPCLAELIGTFGYAIIVLGAICNGQNVLGVSLANGLAVAGMVSATGKISGGHLNPAVTLGTLCAGKISTLNAICYIACQIGGATIATLFILRIYPSEVSKVVVSLSPSTTWQIGLALEAILTFFVVFVVFATVLDERFGFKIGGLGVGTLFAGGILMAWPLTGAAMNPARAFGPALVLGRWDYHFVWWIGPMLGGALAAVIYSLCFQD